LGEVPAYWANAFGHFAQRLAAWLAVGDFINQMYRFKTKLPSTKPSFNSARNPNCAKRLLAVRLFGKKKFLFKQVLKECFSTFKFLLANFNFFKVRFYVF
jgi:hypothetical protein